MEMASTVSEGVTVTPCSRRRRQNSTVLPAISSPSRLSVLEGLSLRRPCLSYHPLQILGLEKLELVGGLHHAAVDRAGKNI